MKRFLVDALFVWLIISLMMYINEPKENTTIDDKISEFEEEIARHERVNQKVEGTRVFKIVQAESRDSAFCMRLI